MFFIVGDENKVLETVHPAEFPLLLSSLYQRFADDLVLAPVIEDFIKDVDGVIAVAKDPDSWNRAKLIFALSLELNENTLARNWVYFRLLYKTCVQPSQPSLQPLASVCWLAPQCKQLEMTDQHNSKLYWYRGSDAPHQVLSRNATLLIKRKIFLVAGFCKSYLLPQTVIESLFKETAQNRLMIRRKIFT